MAIRTVSLSVTAANRNLVQQGGVTFNFDGTYRVGNYANGPAFIVVPSGTATITSITPAQTTESGYVINGAAKNLEWGDDQPFDERTSIGVSQAGEYNTTKQFTTGTVQAGDIIIKAVSNTTAGIVPGSSASTRRGLCDEWAALFVVASPPPDGAFSPSAMGWAGRSAPSHYTVDLEAFVNGLPSYNTTGQTIVPYADLIDHIGKYAPLSIGANNTSYYQEFLPRGFGNEGGAGGNYGEDVNDWINPACLSLISDAFSVQQKQIIARHLIGHGINWGDPLEHVTVPNANGGHYQFHIGPIAMSRAATSRSNATLIADMGINFKGAFQFTAPLLARCVPHSSLADPFTWRRRTISAVAGSGPYTITADFTRSGETGDPSQIFLTTGMRLKRESDGATSNITASDLGGITANATTQRSFTIATQPGTPFAPSDVVYFEPVVMPVSGDFDWTIAGVSLFNQYNPSGSASYRTLNRWLGASLLIKAAGWSGDFDAALGYVNRCQSSTNDPAGDDFPPHNSTTWESEFWAQHGATIFA